MLFIAHFFAITIYSLIMSNGIQSYGILHSCPFILLKGLLQKYRSELLADLPFLMDKWYTRKVSYNKLRLCA